MAFDLRYLIESEFDMFKDRHTAKRGKRHLRDGAGLNLNRKHQNLVADVHKADPNQVGALERLRKLGRGRGFVTFKEGEQLRQKYGLQEEIGYLGTTGIKLVKTLKGYDLIKEAVVKVDGLRYKVNSPDDIWANLPGTHVTFGLKDGIVYYMKGVGDRHTDLFAHMIKGQPGDRFSAFPKPSRGQFQQIKNKIAAFTAEWTKTAKPDDIETWGTAGNPRQFFELSGRLSLTDNIVAFWNPIAKVNQYTNLLRKFFESLNFPGDPIVVTPDNKNGKLGANSINRVNDELMQKQHTVPELKVIMGAKRGSNQMADTAQKAGFNSSAEFDNRHVVGDSVEVK